MRARSNAVLVLAAAVLSVNAAGATALPNLIARVKPAIVTIISEVPGEAMPPFGTGFCVAPDRVITALHVMAGAVEAEVHAADGEYVQVAGIVAADPVHDLAMLQLARPLKHCVALHLNQKLPAQGETIIAIGSPLGLEWTVSEGIVAAIRQLPEAGPVIQHDVPTSPGSSGCPLLDERGNVVGIHTIVITTGGKLVQAGENLNFAIPAAVAASLSPGKLVPLSEEVKTIGQTWEAPVGKQIDTLPLRAVERLDFKAALPFFEAATTRWPDDPYAWCRVGLCYQRTNQIDQAISAYLKAVALKPDFSIAQNNLGVSYSGINKSDEAIAALRHAVDSQPDYAEAWSNLASVYVNVKRFTDAVDAGQHAVKAKDDYPDGHYNLGLAYLGLGQGAKATDEYNALVRLKSALANKLKRRMGVSRTAPGSPNP